MGSLKYTSGDNSASNVNMLVLWSTFLLLVLQPATPTNIRHQEAQPDCGDNHQHCDLDNDTCCELDNKCCKMTDGSVGCCPIKDGVCCPELEKCCYSWQRCGNSTTPCISKGPKPYNASSGFDVKPGIHILKPTTIMEPRNQIIRTNDTTKLLYLKCAT